MYRRQQWQVIMIVTGMVGLAISTASGQDTLRWKFKPREQLTYQMVQSMKMVLVSMGNEIPSSMKQTFDMKWTVEAINDDGSCQMTQTITRIQMESSNGNLEYDSNKKKKTDSVTGQNLANVFDALVGAGFKMTMSSRGEFKDVKIPEKVTKSLTAGQAGIPNLMTPDSLRRIMTQSGIVFPEKGIEKGHKWNRKVETKLPFGTMTIDNKLHYIGPEKVENRELEKIDLKQDITIATPKGSVVKLELADYETSGSIYFDKNAGLLTDSKLKQKMVMQIDLAGNTLKQTIDQTVTMKLITNSSSTKSSKSD